MSYYQKSTKKEPRKVEVRVLADKVEVRLAKSKSWGLVKFLGGWVSEAGYRNCLAQSKNVARWRYVPFLTCFNFKLRLVSILQLELLMIFLCSLHLLSTIEGNIIKCQIKRSNEKVSTNHSAPWGICGLVSQPLGWEWLNFVGWLFF